MPKRIRTLLEQEVSSTDLQAFADHLVRTRYQPALDYLNESARLLAEEEGWDEENVTLLLSRMELHVLEMALSNFTEVEFVLTKEARERLVAKLEEGFKS